MDVDIDDDWHVPIDWNEPGINWDDLTADRDLLTAMDSFTIPAKFKDFPAKFKPKLIKTTPTDFGYTLYPIVLEPGTQTKYITGYTKGGKLYIIKDFLPIYGNPNIYEFIDEIRALDRLNTNEDGSWGLGEKEVCHPNFLCPTEILYNSFGTFFTVTEFIPGISLEEFERRYPPREPADGSKFQRVLTDQEKLSFSKKFLDIMKYMYDKKVYHGDLHSGNIIIREPNDSGELQIVIIDFGMAYLDQDFEMEGADVLAEFWFPDELKRPEIVTGASRPLKASLSSELEKAMSDILPVNLDDDGTDSEIYNRFQKMYTGSAIYDQFQKIYTKFHAASTSHSIW